MSRQSNDQYKEGRLINGFDYRNQAWVLEGLYQACGHPQDMDCHCYGRDHEGEETPTGDLTGTEYPTEPMDTDTPSDYPQDYNSEAQNLMDPW